MSHRQHKRRLVIFANNLWEVLASKWASHISFQIRTNTVCTIHIHRTSVRIRGDRIKHNTNVEPLKYARGQCLSVVECHPCTDKTQCNTEHVKKDGKRLTMLGQVPCFSTLCPCRSLSIKLTLWVRLLTVSFIPSSLDLNSVSFVGHCLLPLKSCEGTGYPRVEINQVMESS